jgi:hypothetical protein
MGNEPRTSESELAYYILQVLQDDFVARKRKEWIPHKEIVERVAGDQYAGTVLTSWDWKHNSKGIPNWKHTLGSIGNSSHVNNPDNPIKLRVLMYHKRTKGAPAAWHLGEQYRNGIRRIPFKPDGKRRRKNIPTATFVDQELRRILEGANEPVSRTWVADQLCDSGITMMMLDAAADRLELTLSRYPNGRETYWSLKKPFRLADVPKKIKGQLQDLPPVTADAAVARTVEILSLYRTLPPNCRAIVRAFVVEANEEKSNVE